ncbi:hypothetical protein [Sorangium sp. So ce1389]
MLSPWASRPLAMSGQRRVTLRPPIDPRSERTARETNEQISSNTLAEGPT